MKKTLCLLLAAIQCCGALAGCQTPSAPETTAATTEPVIQDDGMTRVLVIGHSFGNDSTFLLPQIAMNEGVNNLVLGVLYHSGCRLSKHVSYLQSNAREYAYYEFDTSKNTDWVRADCDGNFSYFGPGMANDAPIQDGSVAQTMEFAIMRQDWDIVILQAGLFEAAGKPATTSNLKPEHIQIIMDYVLSKDIAPATKPVFGWNLIWTLASDPTMAKESNEEVIKRDFGGDHFALYEWGAKTVRDVLDPLYHFAYMIPSGTAMENAKSSYMEDKDVYRDGGHASDFARMMVAYLWLCKLTGKDISEMKVDGVIPARMLMNDLMRLGNTDLVLTESQKQVLIEAVGNALKNPYEMTQSQYTTAP